MPCVIVCGSQYGDEGKGKVVAYLSLKDKPAYVIRGGVGPNAGHNVRYKGKEFECRHVPAGFVSPTAQLRLGAGSLVDSELLVKEVRELDNVGADVEDRMGLDGNCGVVAKEHIDGEKDSEYLNKQIGSMLSGCGKAASERAMRKLKTARDIEELKPFIRDVAKEANDAIDNGQLVVLEGTQGFGLSLYHGAYPYTTSKDTSASAVASDVGIAPFLVDDVFLVVKPYVTRAGMGPMKEEGAVYIHEQEVRSGVVIGDRRRAASFDWELVQRAAVINRPTGFALTNVDRLWSDNVGVKTFEGLTVETKAFISELEEKTGVPVSLISNGPEVEDMIDRREE
jgi:adenylosuccinate synthase